MNQLCLPRSLRGGAALAALLAWPALAVAQVPTIDPSGEPPASEDAGDDGSAYEADVSGPSNPYTRGNAARPAGPPPAQGGGEGMEGEGGASGGYYHTDGYGDVEIDEGLHQGGPGGPVPEVHTVKSGDTLWDLCTYYFESPWEWPKVWSYNPEITNPHWIYPGNQVRLRSGGAVLAPAGGAGGEVGAAPPAGAAPALAAAPPPSSFELRQIAFVDLDDLRFAGRVDGSPEEKTMLALGDEAYIAYPAGKPPRVGSRLSIYQKKRDVTHPETGEVVGAYVRVVGETEILSVKKDKRARAAITDSVDVVERGDRVGPLRQRFATVTPSDASVDVQATILEVLGSDELIGARQVVFLDRGKAHGVAVGNRFYAVRRGDAYAPVMGPNANVGKDDRRFPARAIGELMVVEVGKRTSLAVVTMAVQELGIGDHVVLSRAAN